LLQLLRAFLDVCLLRRRPQDLPASLFLVYLTLAGHALTGLLLSLASHPLGPALVLGLTDTVLLAGLTASLLYVHKLQARLPQTLAALAGTGTLLSLIAFPLTYWWFALHAGAQDPTVPTVLLLAVVVWSLVVMGHILRHALSAPLLIGLVVAVIFYWIAVSVQNALFPLAS